MDEETGTLSEYIPIEADDNIEEDVMFKLYGDYNVDEIGTEEDGTDILYIGINK